MQMNKYHSKNNNRSFCLENQQNAFNVWFCLIIICIILVKGREGKVLEEDNKQPINLKLSTPDPTLYPHYLDKKSG